LRFEPVSVNLTCGRERSAWAFATGQFGSRLRWRDSVANVSQIVTLNRVVLTERVSRISAAKLGLVLAGIDIVLGRR
jgi:mRNA-degrading endonuclease toxin of MazEF toxin-antitoxin module